MRYLRIRVIQDEMIGELGFNLISNGMPNNGSEFVVGQGLIIAHDIIEHQQGLKKIGTLEDELIALGGIVYARGVTGELSNGFTTAEETIAHDICRMFKYSLNNPKFTGHKYYPERLREEYEYDIIRDSIQKSRKILTLDEHDEYYSKGMSIEIQKYLCWTKHLMLHGVYLAERRFGNEHVALHAFKNIQKEVDRFTPEYEGQEFILGYTFNQAKMREVELDEQEWY